MSRVRPAGTLGGHGPAFLPRQQLHLAAASDFISASDGLADSSFGRSSVDLRVGDIAFRVQCGFLPGDQSVLERAAPFVMDELDLRDGGALIERGRPYLVPIKERLNLPQTIEGIASAKASTGRLDIVVRLVCDQGSQFDAIDAGYAGSLYLELTSRSFPLLLCEDLVLSELRLGVFPRPALPEPGEPTAVTVDLSGSGKTKGYRARGDAPPLDPFSTRPSDSSLYWERVEAVVPNSVILQPDSFYLFESNRMVFSDPGLMRLDGHDPVGGDVLSVYPALYVESSPGSHDFACDADGCVSLLPVRTHDIPIAIEHGIKLEVLTPQHVSEEATGGLHDGGLGFEPDIRKLLPSFDLFRSASTNRNH
jgi:dCTP deaminase